MAKAAAHATREIPQVPKLLYRKKDVAVALSLSMRTIERMIANQTLKTRRRGGIVFIPAAEVLAFANDVESYRRPQRSVAEPKPGPSPRLVRMPQRA